MFDEEGFLEGFQNNDLQIIIQNNLNQHQELFDFYTKLNKYSIKLRKNIVVRNKDSKGILALCLYLRIQNLFQSTAVLYKYGLDVEAKLLTRAAIDALIFLKANIIDSHFVRTLIGSEDKEWENTLKEIAKLKDGVYKSVYDKYGGEQLKSELRKLKEENKKKEKKIIRLNDIIEKTGMYDEYYYMYKVLCKDAHINLKRLQDKFLSVENDEVKEALSHPSTKDIKPILDTNCYILLTAIELMRGYINIDIEDEISFFKESAKTIFNE